MVDYGYFEEIRQAGGQAHPIPTRRQWNLLQSWRQVYSARLHAATGIWTWRGFDWHVFCDRYAPAYARQRAIYAYSLLMPPARTIVCPQEDGLPAFEIVGGNLPFFQKNALDVYVWPEGLEWTMAFTHEDGDFGPYFSRREWLEA